MMVKNLVVIIGNLVDQMNVVIIPIKPLLFASHNPVKKKGTHATHFSTWRPRIIIQKI
jgi:hypothetical protein